LTECDQEILRFALPDPVHELSPLSEKRFFAYPEEKERPCAREKRNSSAVTMTPNIEIPSGVTTRMTITNPMNAIDLELQSESEWMETGSFEFDALSLQVTLNLSSTWEDQDEKSLNVSLTYPASAQESPTASIRVERTLTLTCEVTIISGLFGSMTPDNKALPVFDGALGSCDSGCSGTASAVFESE